MRDSVNSAKTLEEDLMNSIQGYGGYQSLDTRSTSDQKLRAHLIHRLVKIDQDLSSLQENIEKCNNKSSREIFQRVVSSLKTIIKSLDKPCYNNTYFFNQKSIGAETLSQIYKHEAHLMDQVDILCDEVGDLKKLNENSEMDDILNHLFDLIDGLNQTMTEREFLIMSEME